MASLTPHRNATERAIASAAKVIAAMPGPRNLAEGQYRRASAALGAVVLREQADALDVGLDLPASLGLVADAIGDAVASLSLSSTGGDADRAARVVALLIARAEAMGQRSLRRRSFTESGVSDQPEAGRA